MNFVNNNIKIGISFRYSLNQIMYLYIISYEKVNSFFDCMELKNKHRKN